MCKTFPSNILPYPLKSDFYKTALQQPKTQINKEDAALSCIILSLSM